MKYKIIGLTTTALVLLAVTLVSLIIPEDNGTRYIEHIIAEEKTDCESHTNNAFCTHLPIVMIDTQGVSIPGRPIYDENHVKIGHILAEDNSEVITAKIKTFDNENHNNHINDTPTLSSDIKIRYRGNSSRSFDKPNYYIRLINEDGTNNSQSFIGMDAHHEWTLHGPFLDKSLIRNYMWYNIAGEIMEYAPNVRFCEVYVNEQYQGLYLAVETITAGKEGARLNIELNKKDNSFSGYIIKLDKGDTYNLQNIMPFTNYALRTHMQHEIVYPGEKNITHELHKAIKDDFSFFEKTLYSYDFDNPKYGYENFIDVNSFVDYFLINELTSNYDAGWMSTYMYKDIDGKYKMCVWDFNSACDFYQDSVMDSNHFEMQNCLWYVMLIKDEAFVDRIIQRYWELRETVFSEEYLYKFIDETVAYLDDAIDRNYSVWGYTFNPQYDMLSPINRNPRTYEDSISQIKNFLHTRLSWTDENIETLRQYSSSSKIKKFNENAN